MALTASARVSARLKRFGAQHGSPADTGSAGRQTRVSARAGLKAFRVAVCIVAQRG